MSKTCPRCGQEVRPALLDDLWSDETGVDTMPGRGSHQQDGASAASLRPTDPRVVIRPVTRPRRRGITAEYVERLHAQGASPFAIDFAESFVERLPARREGD